tara:strand:- start:13830 stop:14033 length:204 start_codon:yes stop_codon:yes gene_type:complete
MSQRVETPGQAVDLLVQAAQLAQKRGAFSLEEAGLLAEAIGLLSALNPESSEEVSDSEETVEEEESE